VRTAGRGGTRQDGTRRDGTRQDGTRQDGTRQDGTRQDGTRQDGTRQDGTRRVVNGPPTTLRDARRGTGGAYASDVVGVAGEDSVLTLPRAVSAA